MSDESTIEKTTMERIDELELAMSNLPPVVSPLQHTFYPGLYKRKIFMEAGSLITSKIHKTCHPFFVMCGKVSVYSDNDGEQLIEAPFDGTTQPATRRILYIHENCVWITVHATDVIPESDSEEDLIKAAWDVEDVIIQKHVNPLLIQKSKKEGGMLCHS
jgi:hypothetical protein